MADNTTTIRLDRFLANAGVMSRRGIKQLLKQQELTVNGVRVRESGFRIDTHKDKILLNGEAIKKPESVYYLVNKPIGIISTTADEHGRDNVVSLVDSPLRLYPIGRLDKDTHGLILLTNDGELTHQLIHPKYHVPKVYKLTISGSASEKQMKAMRNGVMLDDGVTLPAQASILYEKNGKSVLLVTLHEGKNRQIRRMCEAVGLELLDLQRVSFGPIDLGDVELGKYRKLTTEEIKLLKQAVEKTKENNLQEQ
ncbi:MAG TPA: pseudouridine synthase [Patescibacteria group bacterium]|nr:pseudouridine synthase [Patescibacteria group bacterium]